MKTNLLRISIVAVLAAAAVFAQSSTRIQANIPFGFIVGAKAFPAGQYTVDRGPGSGVVAIKSADGKDGAMVLTMPRYSTVTRDTGRLVFHRYGDTYFLSEVWEPGNDGHQLSPATRERELIAKLATPTNTTIAALH